MPSIASAISQLLPDLKDVEVQSDLKKFAAALACVFVAAYVVYSAGSDKNGKTTNFYIYSFFIILPVVIGIFILNPMFQKPMTLSTLYFAGGVGVVVFLAVYLFYRILTPQSVGLATNIIILLIGIAIIVALALFYRIFVRTIANMTGVAGFIARILFFLPCLLIDVIETLFVELKSAPKMVVALFILEIVVVLSYLYVLPLIKKPAISDAINLLDKPVFLTNQITIGTADKLTPPIDALSLTDASGNSTPKRIYYSISMWIYINPQPNSYASNHETDIFRYGLPRMSTGHPRVVYYNKNAPDSESRDQCVVYTSSTDNVGVPIRIPLQSWNHLVISYGDVGIDIFVNGDLVQTVRPADYNTLINNITSSDVVEVGYGDNSLMRSNGAYGAICNVTYYKRPLQAFEIAATYNLNRYRNPPTYN